MSRSPGSTTRLRATIGAHLVSLVAIQLVLVVSLIALTGFQDYRSARRDAALRVEQTAELGADFVASAIEESRSSIEMVPQFAELLATPAVCQFTQPGSQEEWSDGGISSSFMILRTDGTPMCPSADGTTQPSQADQEWFRSALASPEPVEVGPMIDPSTGKHVLIQAAQIPGAGLVVAMVADLSSIGASLDEQFGTNEMAPAFTLATVDRASEISTSGNRHGRDLRSSPFAGPIDAQRRTFDDLEGVERIYAEATVPGTGWPLYAGISTADALSVARNALRERAVVAVVMIALVLAAAFVIQRRFVRPIRALGKGTRRFKEGDLSAQVDPAGPRELTELGNDFNEMAKVRAQSEAALQKAYKAERRAATELREIDTMRNAFLMAISHELRTPLTSVVGYSSLLKESLDSLSRDEVKLSINAMSKQSKRLERLLVDLLDIERLSRGAVQPNLKDVQVRDLVRNVLSNMHVNGQVTVDVKGPVHACVDAALVERIVENLVSNAIKHTKTGTRIWVRAARRDGELRLSVEDDGAGVPDELKERIFEPFKQGDVPEHSPGTGVGLSLVTQFAKLHGGRAWVEDRRGGGAAFRVVLPAKVAKARQVMTRAA